MPHGIHHDVAFYQQQSQPPSRSRPNDRDADHRLLNSEAWAMERFSPEPNELQDLLLALSLSDEGDELEPQESQRSLVRAFRAQPPKRGLFSFEKVWSYANSRLPPHMPPVAVYMPTWRLFCMAADASLTVYDRPRRGEQEHFIKADAHHDTKAMILKSSPIDDQNLIIFAIRGSRMSFADWSINFRREPASPQGFLDDEGNAYHAGFLAVARAMIPVVATRLRQLLEESSSRASSSLLITGHSAGGAIAALLYAHLHSERVQSELTVFNGCFKRVHCITFGAPPISLLPLRKSASARQRKSTFFSIVNEGDPIARAEAPYLRSLARLLASSTNRPEEVRPATVNKKASTLKLNLFKSPAKQTQAPYWDIPHGTLSTAGRIMVMRRKPGSKSATAIEAVTATDEQMRRMVFGDPAMHPMTLYKQRIDQLAIAAVTGTAIK